MDLLDLTGRVVLVTGGCGELGIEIVSVLAKHGATVVVNDIIDEDSAHDVLRKAGVSIRGSTRESAGTAASAPSNPVVYIRADVTDPEAVDQLFVAMEQDVGIPHVVCCHAGMVESHPVSEYPVDGFDELMKLNVRSSFVVAKAASNLWIDRGKEGHLIFTSSWVQDVPWPEITPYNTSKAAVKAMMRGFARELAPKKIRANAVAPGIVAAGMAKRQWDTDPSYRARAERAIPLGYMQPPESVGHVFLFLCSDMASYMTGAVLLADGGCSLYPMD